MAWCLVKHSDNFTFTLDIKAATDLTVCHLKNKLHKGISKGYELLISVFQNHGCFEFYGLNFHKVQYFKNSVCIESLRLRRCVWCVCLCLYSEAVTLKFLFLTNATFVC
jgi:hypothetical protein